MSTTFTGTATDVIQTFTYEETQNKFKLVNNGSVDLHFDVGVFYNKVLHPMQTWENRVDYTEFDIFTLGDGCDFNVTVTNDVEDLVDIGSQLDAITNNGVIEKKEVLTQNAYDALVLAETINETTEYIVVG